MQERLDRVHVLREHRLLDAPIDMLDAQRPADHAGERMQDDEAGAGGAEVGAGRGNALEIETAVGVTLDDDVERQLHAVAFAAPPVRHREAVTALVDLQVFQRGHVGAPVFVAHEKGDGAQRFDAVHAQIAQLAAVEFDAQRAGVEDAAGVVGLFGTDADDRGRRERLVHDYLRSGDGVSPR